MNHGYLHCFRAQVVHETLRFVFHYQCQMLFNMLFSFSMCNEFSQIFQLCQFVMVCIHLFLCIIHTLYRPLHQCLLFS